MNREIKFRGYSEDLKSFVYGFYQEVEVEGIGYSYIFWQGNTTYVRADSVAQFTGMYDKNGKEIYEGDILYNGFNATGIIKFENGAFNCEFEYTNHKKVESENHTFRISNINMITEVIGNIYENPELQ